MSMMKEFKEFAMKGNVIDLAVGVIIGGAFGKIVASLVANIIMPVLGLLIGGVSFSSLSIQLAETGPDVKPAILEYGIFLQNVFDFLIIAFAIFLFIKAINAAKKKEEAKPAAPAAPSKEEVLLTEIRDALRSK